MKSPHLIPVALLFCFYAFTNCVAQDVSSEKSKEVSAADDSSKATALVNRQFLPVKNGFKGNGISYGPFRKGQRPGVKGPTTKQIREDLKILSDDGWQMIRTYGTEPFAQKVCEVIKQDKLPIKLMLGAWIAKEKDVPNQKKANQVQVDLAIKLANEYPDVVCAVSVGNECQVSWSFHKVELPVHIEYVRKVRSSIKQPVTVADDFKFWREEKSQELASELDFIVMHAHPLWLGQQLENAVAWTEERWSEIKKQHPNKLIVIGETGWATEKANHGEQGKLIKGKPGESQQLEFFRKFTDWAKSKKVPYFFFEAFDESWKGGDDPLEVEKHWGIFREDRTRKPAAIKVTGSSKK